MSDKFDGMPHLRNPDEETTDYPGLVVHDGRVTGSITAGESRLPLWAMTKRLTDGGFEEIKKGWDELYGLTADSLSDFLYHLLEQRGDFARLICILADVERVQYDIEDKNHDPQTPAWWQVPEHRQRVRLALQVCLNALTENE